jgi:lipoprotein-anchoring transpeptidase ErfK/SrfK
VIRASGEAWHGLTGYNSKSPFHDEDSTKSALDSNRNPQVGMTLTRIRHFQSSSPILSLALAALVLFPSACDSFDDEAARTPLEVKNEPKGTVPKPPVEESTQAAALAGETGHESQVADAAQDALAGPPQERNTTGNEAAAHPGPWLWVTRSSAAIYASPQPSAGGKIGYVKRGGQIPILEGKVEGAECPRGWFAVASGGYICSHVGTTDKNNKEVKFRPNQPNIEAILPYLYVRNAHNGTPLYKSIPSKEQTYKYEPYLPAAKEAAEALKLTQDKKAPSISAPDQDLEGTSAELPALPEQESGETASSVQGIDPAQAELTEPKAAENATEAAPPPLWEREEGLHEVTLNELRSESDAILEARMMKGFYVAVDKNFKWDGRGWYKTTKGLITPSDRFWATEGSDFHGVELNDEITLPIGWVVGVNTSAPTYEIDIQSDKVTAKGNKKRMEMLALRYRYRLVNEIDYFQLKDGEWIRDRFIRMTTPGPRPAEVGPTERWIDIDISEQTLVVFEGDRPVYATLISSGKESKVKEKDHSTPRGQWRVREKHIASTMDGDGSAAGDLPYSIEDVPYIMYFHKSYATHGAFWHRNYGTQMSHGCVNLAPLDAKWVFFYANPQIPQGFHGNWSTEKDPGSMVVIHD